MNVGAFAGHGDLAFVSRGTLWLLDGATKTLRRVAPPDMRPSSPVFSPDGRWLAFLASRPPGRARAVWLARGDGSGARQIVTGGGLIGWSPAADLLAVTAGNIVNNPDLHGFGRVIWQDKQVEVCQPAATGCARVPSPPGTVTLSPAWSPDGRTLAFARAPYRASPGSPQRAVARWYGAHQLWLYRPGARSLRRLDARGATDPHGPRTARACSMPPATASGCYRGSAASPSGSPLRCSGPETGPPTTGRLAGRHSSPGGRESPGHGSDGRQVGCLTVS